MDGLLLFQKPSSKVIVVVLFLCFSKQQPFLIFGLGLALGELMPGELALNLERVNKMNSRGALFLAWSKMTMHLIVESHFRSTFWGSVHHIAGAYFIPGSSYPGLSSWS
jgi:hypothetical protein